MNFEEEKKELNDLYEKFIELKLSVNSRNDKDLFVFDLQTKDIEKLKMLKKYYGNKIEELKKRKIEFEKKFEPIYIAVCKTNQYNDKTPVRYVKNTDNIIENQKDVLYTLFFNTHLLISEMREIYFGANKKKDKRQEFLVSVMPVLLNSIKDDDECLTKNKNTKEIKEIYENLLNNFQDNGLGFCDKFSFIYMILSMLIKEDNLINILKSITNKNKLKELLMYLNKSKSSQEFFLNFESSKYKKNELYLEMTNKLLFIISRYPLEFYDEWNTK